MTIEVRLRKRQQAQQLHWTFQNVQSIQSDGDLLFIKCEGNRQGWNQLSCDAFFLSDIKELWNNEDHDARSDHPGY